MSSGRANTQHTNVGPGFDNNANNICVLCIYSNRIKPPATDYVCVCHSLACARVPLIDLCPPPHTHTYTPTQWVDKVYTLSVRRSYACVYNSKLCDSARVRANMQHGAQHTHTHSLSSRTLCRPFVHFTRYMCHTRTRECTCVKCAKCLLLITRLTLPIKTDYSVGPVVCISHVLGAIAAAPRPGRFDQQSKWAPF